MLEYSATAGHNLGLKVFAGITAGTLDDIGYFAGVAERAHYDAVVINLSLGEGTPKQKIERVAEQTGIPIVIYDIAQKQGGNPLDVPKNRDLITHCEQIVAAKITTEFEKVIDPWFELTDEGFLETIPGNPRLIAHAVKKGAKAWVAGPSNSEPELFSRKNLITPDGEINPAGILAMLKHLDTRKQETTTEGMKRILTTRGVLSSSAMFSDRKDNYPIAF